MSDELSLTDKIREKESKRPVLGSVNDLCTRKEAIDAAVSVGQTVYDHIATEHGRSFRELERQLVLRIVTMQEQLEAIERRRWVNRLRRAAGWFFEHIMMTRAQYDGAPAPELPPEVTALPQIREFPEWGAESDAWLRAGGVALGPDALNPGDAYRRLRCPSTDVLRQYAEALGGDPAAIEDGETSKAVEGAVLEDVRLLARGETITRSDTRPEIVK